MRFSGVAIGVIICVQCAYSVLRVGEARSLVGNSVGNVTIAAASKAVRLSPDDPETYAARAASLLKAGQPDLALEDLRQATALRHQDYQLWTRLGMSFAQQGETLAALTALRNAEERAPFYAQPHWEAGLLLQKLGHQDEAFKEFRNATLSQPGLLTNVLELAWTAYAQSCDAVQTAVDPRNDEERLLLAHFFISKTKPAEALDVIRSVNLSYYDRKQLLVEFLGRRQFTEAYEVWARGGKKNVRAVGMIDDGGFESGRLSDEVGFTWKINQAAGINVTIDNDAHANGTRSLRIDWQGNSDPGEEFASELILVEPSTTYRLSFAAQTRELATSGGPMVTIIDVSPRNERLLASSSKMSLGTSGWQNHVVSFTTTSSTRAVRVGVRREACPEHPCSIFGTLWLDDFVLSQDSVSQVH